MIKKWNVDICCWNVSLWWPSLFDPKRWDSFEFSLLHLSLYSPTSLEESFRKRKFKRIPSFSLRLLLRPTSFTSFHFWSFFLILFLDDFIVKSLFENKMKTIDHTKSRSFDFFYFCFYFWHFLQFLNFNFNFKNVSSRRFFFLCFLNLFLAFFAIFKFQFQISKMCHLEASFSFIFYCNNLHFYCNNFRISFFQNFKFQFQNKMSNRSFFSTFFQFSFYVGGL